jgi:hypothetical protein
LDDGRRHQEPAGAAPTPPTKAYRPKEEEEELRIKIDHNNFPIRCYIVSSSSSSSFTRHGLSPRKEATSSFFFFFSHSIFIHR